MSKLSKRVLAFLLTGILILFCSCGNDNTAAAENTNAAGQPSTVPPAALPTELPSEPTQAPPTEPTVPSTNIASYAGIWSEENLTWETGGFLLELSAENDVLTIDFSLIGSAPACRIAEISEYVAFSAIDNNIVCVAFENDNWGNSGTLMLELMEDTILCTVSDVAYTESEGFALWGLYDCEAKLVRNENAHEDLTPPPEDNYEEQPSTPPAMTVEDMKSNCLMLEWWSGDFVSESDLTPVMAEDLSESPQYIDHLFVPCETKYYYIVCPHCLGSGFVGEKVCTKTGYDSEDKTENGVHYLLQASVDQAVLRPITINAVMTDLNGNIIYKTRCGWKAFTEEVNIYDMREDKSIPITEETQFVPYLVYLGTTDNVLEFSMFACDIIG